MKLYTIKTQHTLHNNFFQFDFELPNKDESDKLMAMLAEQGFDGFEEDGDMLIAFVPELAFSQEAFEQVLERFSILSYSKTDIENINWNSKWESEFEPVMVDKFVAVRAHFHPPVTNVQYEIIITPKMSFGTGHHSTTFLVMQLMAKLEFPGKSVFDFGTGTGVLAILSEILGAKEVFAIDNDEWSITNTQENIVQNRCNKIEVALMDEIPLGKKYDIILANINLNVITANLANIAAVAHSGADIILSGFLTDNEKVMLQALSTTGFQHVSTSRKGDWLAMMVKKT